MLTQYSLFANNFSGAPAFGGGEYDEMVSGGGQIRPHWQPLMGALHALPEKIIAERVERVYWQYQDTALAYSFDRDRNAAEARRPFDILPMVLGHGEWQALEAGLAQRARLLDRLLADLYGPRRVLTEHLLPQALVFANPRFLRSCFGVLPARAGAHLPVYSADLVRTPDGRWCVAADRIQAPAGIGFALQNRAILARTLPEIFRAQPVRRIEPFFELWKEGLAALAPPLDRPVRIVVMTPGPFNAAYFEHVYLARQLGAQLVEGADLTVRDRGVYVKTLGVLQQVDVILRFIDDDYCDPLELRGDSVLGAAGLLQTVRSGNVVVVNALGSSVAETPALRPFLPRVAEALLGETLALPSLETEWLGMPSAAAQLADRIDEVIVKPAFSMSREKQASFTAIEQAGRKALLDAVQQRPGAYITEARTARSVMPIWTADGLVPRPLTLRMFLVERQGAYTALPGGLSQVPHQNSGGIAPLNSVLTSKDTWVLAGDYDDPVALQRAPYTITAIQPAGDELLSRNADDLFWLGRYTERLDNAARMMRSALGRIVVDQLSPGQMAELRLLIRILAETRHVEPEVAECLPDAAALRRAIAQAVTGDTGLNALFPTIQRIAASLRDRLSNDMWQIVTGLLRQARARLMDDAYDADRLISALDNLVAAIAAHGGMVSENMTRGSGWRFLDMGRRIERGIYGATVLRNVLSAGNTEAEIALSLTLELFDSSITYRSRYLSAFQHGPVVDLVLADERNPRGVGFQLHAIADHLRVLATSFERIDQYRGNWQEQALALAATSLREEIAAESYEDGFDQARSNQTIGLLNRALDRLMALSDTITRAYFSQVQASHSVGYEGHRG